MDEHPEADLRVYAVWFNMIFGDDENQWDDSLLTDERVTEFWDEDRLLGLWFAEQEDFREVRRGSGNSGFTTGYDRKAERRR